VGGKQRDRPSGDVEAAQQSDGDGNYPSLVRPLNFAPSKLELNMEDVLLRVVLVDDLDAMLVVLRRTVFPNAGEVGVHHERGGGRMLDVARSAVDLEER
jgi:hypothetical protein